MSFLELLYQKGASEYKNKREDFLSEVLAELLGLLCADRRHASESSRFLGWFFDDDPQDWSDPVADWGTQFYFADGPKSVQGRRPDIRGTGKANGKTFEVIIENKIDAPFTSSGNLGDTNCHQLAAYRTWLDEYSAQETKKLVLITRYWRHIPSFVKGGVTCRSWLDVHDRLLRLRDAISPATAAGYLTEQTVSLLEDLGMKAVKISLPLVSAFENYEAAVDACRQLGTVAQRCSNSFQSAIAGARMFTPGYTFKDMNPPAYYGTLFTPGTEVSQKGNNPDESALLVWCGVSVKDAYVLRPRQKHIPELHAGIALWIDRKMAQGEIDEALSHLTELERYGFSINVEDDEKTLIRSAIIRKSFFELLMADDTTAAAEAFFAHAFVGMGSLATSTYEQFRRVTGH